MNEPKKIPMSNGPRQKEVKKFRLPQKYADAMCTHPGNDETIEWIKNKIYPETMQEDIYAPKNNKESDQA